MHLRYSPSNWSLGALYDEQHCPMIHVTLHDPVYIELFKLGGGARFFKCKYIHKSDLPPLEKKIKYCNMKPVLIDANVT